MKIAVLGTGMVGQTISDRLIELGHSVHMGSRSANNEKAMAFAAKHPGKASAGTFAEAAAYGELVFNCTKGTETLNILESAGAENLKGKVLIDVTNALLPKDGTVTLAVCNNNSLGEQIQEAFPDVKVVKALNTMWCGIMVNPMMIGKGDHNVFMCGNDAAAKEEVKEILKSFGWMESNIVDLGDIKAARGTEMILPLWLRISGLKKNGAFNFKIIG